jgi:DNA repair exonuclease SbcCD nuclease subunit
VKLLHFADLHLDAPFAWAGREVARRRRRNRRETLTRILRLADEEAVDGVLCAGDLFELDRCSPDTLEFLRASFARLERPIYLAPGNHDYLSPRSPYLQTRWSPNVHLFTANRLEPVTVADGLTLWGAAHRAPANTDDFFAGFLPDRGGVHLVVAHASERSVLPWQESGKEPHAPFDAAEIAAAGVQHAFLGHYHLPRDAEWHTYPGNPDPLDFGETGERGAVIASVAEDGTVSRRRVGVAVSEVHDLTVTLDGAAHADEVAAAVASDLEGIQGSVRVTLTGEVAPSLELDLRDLERLGDGLDGLVLRVAGLGTAYDLEGIAAEHTVRGQFVSAAARIADSELRRRVTLTGLRALAGRHDLEVA